MNLLKDKQLPEPTKEAALVILIYHDDYCFSSYCYTYSEYSPEEKYWMNNDCVELNKEYIKSCEEYCYWQLINKNGILT